MFYLLRLSTTPLQFYPFETAPYTIRTEKQNPVVGSKLIWGNPYRVVLFADPITPGWASRTGG
jgi:hypothetical protein